MIVEEILEENVDVFLGASVGTFDGHWFASLGWRRG